MTKAKNLVVKTSNKFDKVCVDYEKPDGSRGYAELPVNWYFAVARKDESRAKEILSATNYQYSIKDDPAFPNFVKIFCKDIYGDGILQSRSEIVMMLENAGIETYEGDLPNDRRWYIDNSIEIANSFKLLYFDIETDDSQREIIIGGSRILSFAAIDNTGKKYFQSLKEMTDNSERELMLKFLKLIEGYDILLSWNGKQFDVPYLKARMRKMNLNKTHEYRSWYKCAHFDLLARMRHAYRFDSQLKTFNLNYIANHFLGRGKVDHSGQRIIDLYRDNKKLLKEYNLEDCVLIKDIDEKLGVSDMMIRQSSWCGVPPAHFGLYSIIDAYILKSAHKIGMFGRTSVAAIEERDSDNVRGNENPDDATKNEAQYMGAIVLEPKPGRYEKIYTFDYKSLYPSMMRTSNIGYDSIMFEPADGCIINPGTFHNLRKSGIVKPTYFRKTPSVINLAITELLKKRSEYKKLKLKMIEEGTNSGPAWDKVYSDEVVVKELSNSTYGIMGLKYGRYFSVDVAESITLFGQWCIEFARKHFNERGYEVVYGDTDSVFVNTFGKLIDVEKELEIYHIRLHKELKDVYNIDECYVQLDFDKEYKGFILIAKKTYVGQVINQEGKKTNALYGRGIDFIKKNTFGFAKKKQIELINMCLLQHLSEDSLKTWLYATKDEYMQTEFSLEDITLIHKVGKSLDSYRGTPPIHIRVAKELEKRVGTVYRGTEIEYVIVQSPHGEPAQGILASDFTGQYDKNYYWDHKTLPTFYRIIGAMHPGATHWEGVEAEPIVKKIRKKNQTLASQLSLF